MRLVTQGRGCKLTQVPKLFVLPPAACKYSVYDKAIFHYARQKRIELFLIVCGVGASCFDKEPMPQSPHAVKNTHGKSEMYTVVVM